MLLKHHGLHLEIVIDRTHPIGKDDPAGVADVIMESAVTTIRIARTPSPPSMPRTRSLVYRNWLGLMHGTLAATFEKGGQTMTRQLNPDRHLHARRTAASSSLPGRSLMLVRNVGHHMYTDAVLRRRRAARSRRASSMPRSPR